MLRLILQRSRHRISFQRRQYELESSHTPLQRPYSVRYSAAEGDLVQLKVEHGISKPIDIRINYPRCARNGQPPIILALGDGLSTHKPIKYIKTLSECTNATIVQPLYSISSNWCFPAPIHMTLAVFDWICQNLVEGPGEHNIQRHPRLGVCGELVGGGLAAMLALTESNPARPHISAAAIGNPILDWTSIFPSNRDMVVDDIQPVEQGSNWGPKAPNCEATDDLSPSGLISLRKRIFRKAEHFFDPFASPLLFFRTPGFDLPYSLQGQGFFKVEADQGNGPSSSDPDVDVIKRKRTYYRAFPPKASGMFLPSTRINTSVDFALRSQSEELVAMMSRNGPDSNRFTEPTEVETVDPGFLVEPGTVSDLWNKHDVTETGQWLGEVLSRR